MPGALTECMEQYRGLVWSLARELLRTSADAEDAVQEIFMDVWRSAGRFDRRIASEATFVATIARRRLIDRARRARRRPAAMDFQEGGMEPAATAPSPEDAPETGETAALARKAMGQLRPEQQRVLQMAIFHGASHEQISASTGMPLGTVKTHARRGLIRLRELLSEAGLPLPPATPG